MPNKDLQYFTGDTVTFRGVFEVEDVEQTPDDGTCIVTIIKRGASSPIVSDVAGIIAGNQLRYKYENIPIGQYAIFLTAQYGSGADKRTGKIEFMVRNKEAS